MNKIHTILILSLSLMLPGCGVSQKNALVQVQSDYDINEKIIDIHVDNLQNIYILTKENKVVKYTESFEKEYVYSNNILGEIKSIDATNPQKILCFIQIFNRILVLDNFLSEINRIDLSTSEFLDISVVARSNDNQIWLFDPINQALVKVNDLLERQYESNRLSDLNLGTIDPVILKERGNIVAMSDPNIGVLIFDNFGQFLKLIPEKGIEDFQIFGKYLFFTQNKKYYQYHIDLFEKSELKDMKVGFDQFLMSKTNFYYVNDYGVLVLKRN